MFVRLTHKKNLLRRKLPWEVVAYNCPTYFYKKEKGTDLLTCSLWLRRLDLNQRPSGISHKASPCLPLENIVAPLAWSASRLSLFSHLSATPVSAAGGGVPLRPNERSSPCHNPEKKRSRSLDLLLVVRTFIRDLVKYIFTDSRT